MEAIINELAGILAAAQKVSRGIGDAYGAATRYARDNGHVGVLHLGMGPRRGITYLVRREESGDRVWIENYGPDMQFISEKFFICSDLAPVIEQAIKQAKEQSK